MKTKYKVVLGDYEIFHERLDSYLNSGYKMESGSFQASTYFSGREGHGGRQEFVYFCLVSKKEEYNAEVNQ